MNLNDVKQRHKKYPYSCWTGVVIGLVGLGVSVAYLFELFGGSQLLPMKTFLVLGPGLMVAGGILWSEWGRFVETGIKAVQKFIKKWTEN